MTQEQLNDVNKALISLGIENIQNIILIRKGATNGEVMMAVFKEVQHYSDGKICASWWNSPFRKEVEEW